FLAVSAATGCNNQEDKAKEAKSDAASKEKKQAQIEALLKENGSGPLAQPTPAPGSAARSAPDQKPAPGTPAAEAGAPANSQIVVKLVSAGTGPKQKLSYQFEVGRERNFAMDMEILSSRITNGQKEPGPPPITLVLTGTTK